jgi:hypothetical protein
MEMTRSRPQRKQIRHRKVDWERSGSAFRVSPRTFQSQYRKAWAWRTKERKKNRGNEGIFEVYLSERLRPLEHHQPRRLGIFRTSKARESVSASEFQQGIVSSIFKKVCRRLREAKKIVQTSTKTKLRKKQHQNRENSKDTQTLTI